MSSESISPQSFYEMRGYGYKHFEKVELNSLDNTILLYEEFPDFSIDDSELENFAMVIEISPEFCNAKISSVGEGVYKCHETIYLNPFNTLFYFNRKTELVSTRAKSRPSVEAKFANLYKGCLKVVASSVKRRKYKAHIDVQDSFDRAAFEQDVRINKLKGFVYSYIIAANRSCSDNVALLKMHCKQLINTLSAATTSPNGYIQSEAIDKLYADVRRDIEKIEGIQSKVDSIMKAKSDEYQVPNLIDILRKEGLYDSWNIKIKNTYGLKTKVTLEKFVASIGADRLQALDGYEQYLDSIVSFYNSQRPALPVNLVPQICSERIIALAEGDKQFVVSLLNMYLNESIEKDKFLAGRYNYARMGGTMFRDALGDKWENSEERRYVNALLKNINEYTAFDINSSTNLTLKSFAAFFQKGDIEVRKLEDYLTSSGIGDFRMAFSLWGVVFGFADMPKTYTTHLFDSADQEYIEAIYKFIYKSLFGKDLEGSICPYVEPKDDEPKSTLGRFIEGVVDIATRPFIGKNEDAKNYPEALACVFESEEFGLLSSAAKQHYKNACIECWQGQIDAQFIVRVQGIKPFAKTKGKWEKCVKILKQQLPSKPRTRKKTRDCNNGLFNFDAQPAEVVASKIDGSNTGIGARKDKVTYREFYRDKSVFYELENILPQDSSIRARFKEDLWWFQEEYIKGDRSKYYATFDRDNVSVIRAFERYIKKKDYSNRINVEYICTTLLHKYANK